MTEIYQILRHHIPAEMPHYVNLRANYCFEQDDHIARSPGSYSDKIPLANYAWNLDLFDPKNAALPGSPTVMPPPFAYTKMLGYIKEAPVLTASLSRFALDLHRGNIQKSRVLRVVQRETLVDKFALTMAGTLDDRKAVFLADTIFLAQGSEERVVHDCTQVRCMDEMVREIDTAVASIPPNTGIEEAGEHMTVHLAQTLPDFLHGCSTEIFETRSGDR